MSSRARISVAMQERVYITEGPLIQRGNCKANTTGLIRVRLWFVEGVKSVNWQTKSGNEQEPEQDGI